MSFGQTQETTDNKAIRELRDAVIDNAEKTKKLSQITLGLTVVMALIAVLEFSTNILPKMAGFFCV